MLSSGFTLIFGLMRVVNLAHGSLYLFGGYCGYIAWTASGSYLLALLAGAASMAVVGLAIERLLLARMRGDFIAELLVTMGLAYIMADLALAFFGGDPRQLPMPGVLGRSSALGSLIYPNARIVILFSAIALAALLYFVISRTKIGAIIRAGVDDNEMVDALGIPIRRVFLAVFVAGSALAGLSGVLGAGVLSLYPGADSEILALGLVVVTIGGLGSLRGAIVGSLVVGLLANYGQTYFPDLSYFAIFAPMAIILLWRPNGLFGVRGT
jgi:branched-chain amino acid transport system permease protein